MKTNHGPGTYRTMAPDHPLEARLSPTANHEFLFQGWYWDRYIQRWRFCYPISWMRSSWAQLSRRGRALLDNVEDSFPRKMIVTSILDSTLNILWLQEAQWSTNEQRHQQQETAFRANWRRDDEMSIYVYNLAWVSAYGRVPLELAFVAIWMENSFAPLVQLLRHTHAQSWNCPSILGERRRARPASLRHSGRNGHSNWRHNHVWKTVLDDLIWGREAKKLNYDTWNPCINWNNARPAGRKYQVPNVGAQSFQSWTDIDAVSQYGIQLRQIV